MIKLMPDWAAEYNEFWDSVIRRNLFFIKLRFGAIIMLAVLTAFLELSDKFSLSNSQLTVIILVISSITIYNFILLAVRPRLKKITSKFNPLHLSLAQIILDFIALTILVYFLGGIESPLFLFYIFHMIIGSLILPGAVVYTIAVFIIFIVNSLFILEYFQAIPHHHINGLLTVEFYNQPYYLIAVIMIFSLMMIISVMLANRIAFQLYQRERQLYQTLDKLNSAESEKQKYIMGVVHEIKSPVAAVQSILDLIIKGYVGKAPEKIQEKLKRAQVRTAESIDLINRILSISRIRLINGKGAEKIEAEELIRNIIRQTEDLCNSKNININFKKPIHSAREIPGDRDLLQLAFSNIIGNSIKYSFPDGRIEIELTYLKSYLEVVVSDNGVGIPAEDIDKIFEKNYRASNVNRKDFEGSGMGLSLVKEIIEQHQGNISVKSPSRIGFKHKPGAEFIIRLPYSSEYKLLIQPERKTIIGGV